MTSSNQRTLFCWLSEQNVFNCIFEVDEGADSVLAAWNLDGLAIVDHSHKVVLVFTITSFLVARLAPQLKKNLTGVWWPFTIPDSKCGQNREDRRIVTRIKVPLGVLLSFHFFSRTLR
eukprot:TRINITY_DN2543_c0_g1_i4.p1 TRINITY_DN2543_c0_g1~~TRINITY_DN2543_c0_g1_i4.p1  ORF type:complete len:118 (+),score=19.63 TRINITY_DN2543_c0_g1_i4:187-540(+)